MEKWKENVLKTCIVLLGVMGLFLPAWDAEASEEWSPTPDPIKPGTLTVSPGPIVCVGTKVAARCKGAEDSDTKTTCKDGRVETKRFQDPTLRNYWRVEKDGVVYQGIERKELEVNQKLKFTPEEPGYYVVEVYADDKWDCPEGEGRNDPSSATQSVTVTILKVEASFDPPENYATQSSTLNIRIEPSIDSSANLRLSKVHGGVFAHFGMLRTTKTISIEDGSASVRVYTEDLQVTNTNDINILTNESCCCTLAA